MAREILFRAEIRGDEELQKVLHDLASDQELTGILRPALLKAARPVEGSMETNAPRSHGYDARHRRALGLPALHTTIGVNFGKTGGRNFANSTAVCRVRIGPVYPAGAHGHLTEFGTVQRFKKGDRRLAFLRALRLGRITHNVLKVLRARGLVATFHINSGAAPAQHWMLRSWRQTGDRALLDLRTFIGEGILHRAAYLRKKYGRGGAR